MYLSLKQHDLFLTLLMGFEIPFRTYVSETVLTKYDTYGAFENELISRRDNLSPSDPLFLRNQLPNICSERKCSDLYDKFITSKNNKSLSIIETDQDIPMIGSLNVVTFAFTEDFSDLYLLFGGYTGYCTLAEKYRYARNKLGHPGCKTLEDTDLVPVLSFVKDIVIFLDDSYFSQKSREELLLEVSVLQNRKITIPISKHNFQEMPYGESKIVCREVEIEKLIKFICGNPNDLRKQHSCCVYGYGGVGKTALVLEVVKRIVQNILDDKSINEYKPQYILFFSAKKHKLDIAPANGKIIEKSIHKYIENADDLIQHILNAIGLNDLRGFHEEGLIIVDNLEAISSAERKKIKQFIESQTPSEMQFLITSRNSEEYEMNFKLSGFEHDSGINFTNQYILENGLDLDISFSEIEELLSLAKGNTLVLVLCLRRLSQRLASISGLQSEFSSVNAWKNIKNSLKNFPGNAYEVISEFMFRDTFEEIEEVFADNCVLFHKILKIFAVYQGDGVDLNTICLLSKESYPRVEAVADTLCNYLILEKRGEQYNLNNFAEKYIVNRFMPDATTFNELSIEISKRESQVQKELEELNHDIKMRPELAKIMSDWCIISDSDRITAASMYRLYGDANRECKKDSRFKAEAILEEVIKESKEAESITAHPYIKYQKARILQLIDRSKILEQSHKDEIVEGFRNAVFIIKTVEQFSRIQNTKSYASLLWIFGQYLSDINRFEESIRYLEEGREAFESMKILDKEYYQCLSKLGTVYLDYYEENQVEHEKYLLLSSKISSLLQKYYRRLGSSKAFAMTLKQRLQKYNHKIIIKP